MRRVEPYFRGLINEDFVVRRANYEDTKGRCPPYMVYVDHEARDICLVVRGLKSSQIADYEILLDQKKGAEVSDAVPFGINNREGAREMPSLFPLPFASWQRLDGGFVHTGMLKAAAWLLDQEMPVLTMLARCHLDYSLTLTGHSLGSGVVAMATVILHASREHVGFSVRRLRCFCMAPARSMSLNLAIKYADVINSVVLQVRARHSHGSNPAVPAMRTCSIRTCCWLLVTRPLLASTYMLLFTLLSSYILCHYFLPVHTPSLPHLAPSLPHTDVSHACVPRFLPLGPPLCHSLPCMLLYKYQQDARIPTADKLKDPRRLYAPGRLFHVLYRPQAGMAQHPRPVVKTAVPVDHRFERVVLSPSIISDHIIGHIEAKCALALAVSPPYHSSHPPLLCPHLISLWPPVSLPAIPIRECALSVLAAMEAEQQVQQTPPEEQRMERSATLKERRGEHLEALARAVSLHVPHAADPSSLPHLHSDETEEAAEEEEDTVGKDGEPREKEADGGEKGGEGVVDGERGELLGVGAEEAMERARAEVEKVRAEVEKAAGVVAGKWTEIVDGLVATAAQEVTKVAPGLAEDNAQEWQ
ncbi:unnamed protein product [Closterium sp. NIES-54]